MRPIEYFKEFTLKISETVKKNTVFEVPVDSKFAVNNALEKIKLLEIEPTKEFLLCLTENFLETLTPEIKKCLLVYYYWKHSRGTQRNDPDFISNKKIVEKLKYKNQEFDKREWRFTHPFECPICGEKNEVMFKGLIAPEIVSFTRCYNCSHLIGNSISSECSCSICKSIISEANNFFCNIETAAQDWAKDLLNKNVVENLTEERLKWYATHKSSDLSKSERELISFKPKDVTEVENFVSKKKGAMMLLEGLKEKKVIFKKYHPLDLNELIKQFLHCFLFFYKTKHGVGHVYGDCIDTSRLNVNEIRLSEYNELEIEFKLSIDFIAKDSSKEIEISTFQFRMTEDTLKTCHITEELNPYFFSNEVLPKSNKFNENTKCLFYSGAEMNQYHFLIRKYKDAIIQVNMRMKDLIDLIKIKSCFKQSDYNYLEKCKLDFVIFDNDGIPIKVIELQRGLHHDTIDYINKDKIKRLAIERAGLLFEEIF